MCKLIPFQTNHNTTLNIADIKYNHISSICELAKQCDKIEAIYLFGSTLEERCNDTSDIDIAIISSVNKSSLFKTKSYNEFTSKLYSSDAEQEYDILHFKSEDDLRRNKSYVCKNIITQGKIIYKRTA